MKNLRGKNRIKSLVVHSGLRQAWSINPVDGNYCPRSIDFAPHTY